MIKKYYVYISFYRDIVIYVGKGKGSRLSHTFGGESSNRVLNEFYFRNMYLNDFPLETRKVKDFYTEKEALDYESNMIRKYQPVGNRSMRLWVNKSMSNYLTKKLNNILNSDKVRPELITTKYDEDLIYTQFGLPCTINSKVFPKFLTRCENGNVRLSDDMLEHFPNKSSKFLFSKDRVPSNIFIEHTFSDVFREIVNSEKVMVTKYLKTTWFNGNKALINLNTENLTKILPELASKVPCNQVSDVLDPDLVKQIKWERNVRLILLRKGFPDDFEDSFGYLHLVKDKGFYFTEKSNPNLKKLSLTALNKLDLSEFKKKRVPF